MPLIRGPAGGSFDAADLVTKGFQAVDDVLAAVCPFVPRALKDAFGATARSRAPAFWRFLSGSTGAIFAPWQALASCSLTAATVENACAQLPAIRSLSPGELGDDLAQLGLSVVDSERLQKFYSGFVAVYIPWLENLCSGRRIDANRLLDLMRFLVKEMSSADVNAAISAFERATGVTTKLTANRTAFSSTRSTSTTRSAAKESLDAAPERTIIRDRAPLRPAPTPAATTPTTTADQGGGLAIPFALAALAFL